MNRKLYITAIITTPIIALYGASPFFIFEKVLFVEWIKLIAGISLEVIIVWLIQIYFELKFPKQQLVIRFVITYIISFLFRFPALFIISPFKSIVPNLVERYLAYPILASFAINLIVMIVVRAIVNGYKQAISEKQIQELKWQNTEAQKQVLMQQLQPHFLFNALSVLKSLITENPTEAENYTVQLSEFLRYTVKSRNEELVTLETELNFINDYLHLQQIRFGDAVTCKIDINEAYLQRKIPVLALQVLLENVFKHNYFTDKKPMQINIFAENDLLVVRNEKISIKLAQGSGTGLTNLNARYQLICDKRIEINESEKDFEVKIPLLPC